jgi:hypothetical protein
VYKIILKKTDARTLETTFCSNSLGRLENPPFKMKYKEDMLFRTKENTSGKPMKFSLFKYFFSDHVICV